MMKAPTRLFYEFGEFRLDVERHRLLRQGEIVAVTPKAVEILRVLVERPGRLVERNELMNSVWRDVAVEDGNLTVTISMLRKALGEDTNGRRFIETVPRLGYKFVADVREVSEEVPALIVERQTVARLTIDEEIGSTKSTLLSRLRPRSGRQIAIVVALATGVVITVGALAYLRQSTSSGNNTVKANIDSIAILPLRSLNQNPDDHALSLGFADALITSLGKVQGVRVLSAGTLSRNANTQDPLVIGRELGVDSIVEGTLQRANGKLRITLRLLRTSDGAQIWSNSFDGEENEIFKLQDTMAAQTAQSLKWNLSGDQKRQAARRYTENLDAYQSYLRGRVLFDRRNREGYEKAIAEFERAIEFDQNYALAFSGLADVYSLQANTDDGEHRNELYEKARIAASKALVLDETIAEAHTSLGWIRRVHDWDWQGAESEFKRAIELNPNYTNAHQWYALLLTTVGRLDEALVEIETARELEPISTVVLGNYLSVRLARRDYDSLPAIAQQLTRLDPDSYFTARNISIVYLNRGNYAKVIEAEEDYLAKHNDKSMSDYLTSNLAVAYARSGQKEKAEATLRRLEQKANNGNETSYRLAMAYSDLDRKDRAINLLQECLLAHDDRMVWIKVEPRFDSLRDDKRFQELLRKMNL